MVRSHPVVEMSDAKLAGQDRQHRVHHAAVKRPQEGANRQPGKGAVLSKPAYARSGWCVRRRAWRLRPLDGRQHGPDPLPGAFGAKRSMVTRHHTLTRAVRPAAPESRAGTSRPGALRLTPNTGRRSSRRSGTP